MDDQHTQSPVIGVDVSKRKCDVALLLAGKLKHKTIANTPAGFEQLVQLKGTEGINFIPSVPVFHLHRDDYGVLPKYKWLEHYVELSEQYFENNA